MIVKICKKCGFQGNKNDFNGRSCKVCYRKSRRVPAVSVRACKSCGLKKELKFKVRLCFECQELSRQNTVLKERDGAKKYYYKHQDEVLAARLKNRNKIRPIRNVYRNNRRKNDASFKLQHRISVAVRSMLRVNGGSKGGLSILKFLPYSMQELKEHLEKQFEPWMTWNNYGIYNIRTWNDNDTNTWRWNIDHIIPQSKLPYSSMKEDNFIECWILDNLRPLSAKHNLLKGNR